MARVIMMVAMCGPGVSLVRGDEHEFPADEALRLVDAQIAKPATDEVRAELDALRAAAADVIEPAADAPAEPQADVIEPAAEAAVADEQPAKPAGRRARS